MNAKLRSLVLLVPAWCAMAQGAHQPASSAPAIYIAPSNGFEVSLAAAITKKNAQVQIVTNESQAEYVLRATPIEQHIESGAGKYARCRFALCFGIEDGGDVSVQLISRSSDRVVWAYQVTKERGARTRQSMAEAVAKHFQRDFIAGGW